jgi:hypothetical protein
MDKHQSVRRYVIPEAELSPARPPVLNDFRALSCSPYEFYLPELESLLKTERVQALWESITTFGKNSSPHLHYSKPFHSDFASCRSPRNVCHPTYARRHLRDYDDP